eukprot:GHVU01032464.1.p1 GENE.GHVU01032464.1~~GHVU01032464.1.p1  ORF type:complete len:127 (-),score=11.29 GHVU01032464.1:215-595(-)
MHDGVLVPRSTGNNKWDAHIQGAGTFSGTWNEIFLDSDKVGWHKALRRVLQNTKVQDPIGRLKSPKLYLLTVDLEWIELEESEGLGESNALDLKYVPTKLEFLIASANVSPGKVGVPRLSVFHQPL